MSIRKTALLTVGTVLILFAIAATIYVWAWQDVIEAVKHFNEVP